MLKTPEQLKGAIPSFFLPNVFLHTSIHHCSFLKISSAWLETPSKSSLSQVER